MTTDHLIGWYLILPNKNSAKIQYESAQLYYFEVVNKEKSHQKENEKTRSRGGARARGRGRGRSRGTRTATRRKRRRATNKEEQ